jgi:hypothetical protein
MHDSSPSNRMIPADTVTVRRDRIADPGALHARALSMIESLCPDGATRAMVIDDADARTRAALLSLNTRSKSEHGHHALAATLAYAALAKAIPPALTNMLDGIEQ